MYRIGLIGSQTLIQMPFMAAQVFKQDLHPLFFRNLAHAVVVDLQFLMERARMIQDVFDRFEWHRLLLGLGLILP